MIDASIIIVNWNTKEHLRNCLQSIYDTVKLITFEIIVVDNNSDDNSQKMVSDEFPNVLLTCNSANLGFAKANNIGIKQGKGRYKCLINSDVVLLENTIDTLIEYMDKNEDIGIISPKILNSDGTLQQNCRQFPNLYNSFCAALSLQNINPRSRIFSAYFMTWWGYDTIAEVDLLSGCFWLIRDSALLEVGLLDEMFFIYAEDIDFCKRFHDKKLKVVFYPYVSAIHIGNASAKNAPTRFYIEMCKADLQYWKKHHGIIKMMLFKLILIFHQLVRIVGYSVFYFVFRKKNFILQRSVSCFKWLVFG